MKPDKILLLVGVLVLATVPFAAWGALRIVARVWKANLRPTLPWLRASRWVAWLVGMLTASTGLISHEHFWLLPIGLSMAGASGGLALVERWVKREYSPELSAASLDDRLAGRE